MSKDPTDLQSGFKLLTVNYYDNYVYPNAPTVPTSSTQVEGQDVQVNCTGLLTGTWVRTLTSQSPAQGETSYMYYDKKARPIRTRLTNYLGGYTQADNVLGFDGRLLFTLTRHKRLSSDTELVTREVNTYDAQDRLVRQTHKVNEMQAQLMADNTFDAIGRLTQKNVGNTQFAPLQKVNYSYNVRGSVVGINNVFDLNNGGSSSQPQDLFAFEINYNNPIADNLNGAVKPQYNGNIAEVTWRTASDNIQRRYGFKYDDVGRMLDAYYQMPQTSVPVRNSYNEHVTYDQNGNIKTLVRNGNQDSPTLVEEIDDLTYTYDGNRLTKVTDSSLNPLGFKDVNQSNTNDYTYDFYGNMLTDKNKGINTAILYNHLNLPVTIVINDGAQNNGTISYLYDAGGTRLKKTVTNNSTNPATVTTTDYIEGYQYVNTVLEFFPTSEGYVKHTKVGTTSNYNYVFQYKDHLGNNRVSYTVDKNNVLRILEEDHYYPFGLKHEGYSADQRVIRGTEGTGVVIVPVINPGDVSYKYMYSGKEMQDELGLNNYDFGARNYDPALGRWMNIDPLAETSRRWSPYTYAYNNPLRYIDPDGMQNEDLKDSPYFDVMVDMGYYSREKGSVGSAVSYSKVKIGITKRGMARINNDVKEYLDQAGYWDHDRNAPESLYDKDESVREYIIQDMIASIEPLRILASASGVMDKNGNVNAKYEPKIEDSNGREAEAIYREAENQVAFSSKIFIDARYAFFVMAHELLHSWDFKGSSMFLSFFPGNAQSLTSVKRAVTEVRAYEMMKYFGYELNEQQDALYEMWLKIATSADNPFPIEKWMIQSYPVFFDNIQKD